VSMEVEEVVDGSRDIEGVEVAERGGDIGLGSLGDTAGEEEKENKR